jgi:SAM-dependent methyltransferase
MSDYSVSDIIKTYDAYADERDHAGLKPENARNVDEAMALFRKRGVKSILEIGSGPGNAAEVFHAAKFDIECIDLSPRMIELVTDKGIPGRVLDCREIASIGRVYDAAFSINALLHIPNAELPSVLQSISDVLVEKGLFALGLWGGDDIEGIYEEDHYRPKRFFSLYSQRTLLSFLSDVFQIEEYHRIEFDGDKFFHKVVLSKPTV